MQICCQCCVCFCLPLCQQLQFGDQYFWLEWQCPGLPLQRTPGIISELPLYFQSSRHSFRVQTPPVLPPGSPEAASEKCVPVVGKPSWSIPTEPPPINYGPLTSQMTARPAGSRDRQILFTLSTWKRGNSDSWAIRLWKVRTSCDAWCFLVFCRIFKQHTGTT